MAREYTEIAQDYDVAFSLRRQPVALIRYKEGYIFDPDKSVNWNISEVKRRNAEFDREMQKLREDKQKRINQYYNEMISAIAENNSISENVARKLFEKVRSENDYAEQHLEAGAEYIDDIIDIIKEDFTLVSKKGC